MTGLPDDSAVPDLTRLRGRQLSTLLEMAVPQRCHPEIDAFARALSDEMKRPLAAAWSSDLGAVQGVSLHGSMARMTIGEALLTGQASLRACRAIKEYAQSHRRGPSSVPAEVSTVLYYAAIAAGICQHQCTISSLTFNRLHEGLIWCAAQEWVSEDIRALCSQAASLLSQAPDSGSLGAAGDNPP